MDFKNVKVILKNGIFDWIQHCCLTVKFLQQCHKDVVYSHDHDDTDSDKALPQGKQSSPRSY